MDNTPGGKGCQGRSCRGVAPKRYPADGMVKDYSVRRGSVGTTLPKDMVDRLHLALGDRVLALAPCPGRRLKISAEDLER